MKGVVQHKYNTVVFDLDGTILYTYAFHKKAFKAFFKKYWDISDEVDISPFISNTMKEIYKKIGIPAEKISFYQSALNNFYKNEVNDLYNGLVVPQDMLKVLQLLKIKGIKMAVISNSSDVFVKKVIESKGLSSFFDFVSGMELDFGDKVNRCAALLNGTSWKGNFIYIGDTPGDIEMSNKLGIDSILLYSALSWMYPYDYKLMDPKPTYTILFKRIIEYLN
ncbi:MAG: HAD hydrolase-like protein [Bacillota bacterium]